MALGEPIPMLDSIARVTGSIQYLSNLRLPGMLFGAIARSRVPHARLLGVDTERAARAPGVRAVVTGALLAPHAFIGGNDKGQPIVAVDRVRHAGEPIAVVAADDRASAVAAAALVEARYDERPAVFEPSAATRPGAPVVHDDHPDNVYAHFKLRHGDLAAAFAAADHVFEDTFTSPTAQATSLEPHGAIAAWQGDQLTVWSGTQAPWALRAVLQKTFGLADGAVRVVVPPLGGGYGAKSPPFLEPLVAAIARRTGGRPVQIVLSRAEEFVTVVKHAATITLKTGVRRDGTLTGRQATVRWNGGAYATASQTLVEAGLVRVVGPYRFQAVHVDSIGVHTNLPPSASYRGAMQSQTTWAHESQMDMIARRLGIHPVELRRKNLLRDGDHFATGETMHDLHFVECLEAAARGLDAAPLPPRTATKSYGRGYAVMMKNPIGTSRSQARLRRGADGKVTLYTSTVEMGQGAHTALAQIAADALGIPVGHVRVVGPDTSETPFDQITVASRSTEMMGAAVRDAARKLKEKLATAPPHADVAADGEHATHFKLDPHTAQGVTAADWHQGAGAAEVEVDHETGEVRVVRYHAAAWAGRVVNRRAAELQNLGNVVFGLGPTLMEEVVIEEGHVANASLYDFRDYRIPSFRDIPHALTGECLEAPNAQPSGLGEMTLPPVSPAVAAAVEDATGVRITDLPLRADRVLRALEEKRR